jgi:hypothetical protein
MNLKFLIGLSCSFKREGGGVPDAAATGGGCTFLLADNADQ